MWQITTATHLVWTTHWEILVNDARHMHWKLDHVVDVSELRVDVHLHLPNGCCSIKAGCCKVSAIGGPAATPNATVMSLFKDGCTYPSISGAMLLPDPDGFVSTAACYAVSCDTFAPAK